MILATVYAQAIVTLSRTVPLISSRSNLVWKEQIQTRTASCRQKWYEQKNTFLLQKR